MKAFAAFCIFLFLVLRVEAQCSGYPSTVAESGCGTGSPLASNANINSGTTFSYCNTGSGNTSFSSINLSGGTINICGNATISSGNFNSGVIVVACGATLTFNSLLLNSNVKIVNYGRVNINGTLTFQNNGNCFYNETTQASLYVSQDIIWPQNTSDNSYVKNKGYIKVGGTFNARNGVYYCSTPGSILETVNFTYGTGCGAPAFRFTDDGSIGTSIIRYTGAAVLNGMVTSSPNYAVNRGTSSTVNSACGGWGSATVATNSPAYVIPSSPGPCPANPSGCFTALSVTLTDFHADVEESRVDLNWTTASEKNSSHFRVQRSREGEEWITLGAVEAAGNSSTPRSYNFIDEQPVRGLSYYRLEQIDLDGQVESSHSLSVSVPTSGGVLVYPNPAQTDVVIEASQPVASLRLVDELGRIIPVEINDSNGLLQVQLDLLGNGTYLLFVQYADGEQEIVRVVVRR